VYILILPAFGIISHVVADNSNRPIFGQDGPLIYYSNKLTQQTICKKLRDKNNFIKYTKYYILKKNIVKIFVLINNSQITNTQILKISKFLNLIKRVKHVSRNLRGHTFVISY